MNVVIKRPPPPHDRREVYIAAMWLIYCRAPRKAEPDVDGMYDLSEIGSVPEKNFSRATPYSIARPKQ
jgi:hypothetical protein